MRIRLNQRAEFRHRGAVHIVHKLDAMRFAHRYASYPVRLPGDGEGNARGRITRESRGNSGGLQYRFSHVDANPRDTASIDLEFHREDATAGFDPESVFWCNTLFIHVFGHAAQAIAAHFCLEPVGVIHPHPGVRALGRADQDQPVAADAQMPVAHSAAQFGRVCRKSFLEAVYENVVVAGALHLCKTHDHPNGPGCGIRQRVTRTAKCRLVAEFTSSRDIRVGKPEGW